MREESPTFLLFLILSATAIPNATVTWWFRGKEIGRSGAGAGDLDRNFDIRGHGEIVVVITDQRQQVDKCSAHQVRPRS